MSKKTKATQFTIMTKTTYKTLERGGGVGRLVLPESKMLQKDLHFKVSLGYLASLKPV